MSRKINIIKLKRLYWFIFKI